MIRFLAFKTLALASFTQKLALPSAFSFKRSDIDA